MQLFRRSQEDENSQNETIPTPAHSSESVVTGEVDNTESVVNHSFSEDAVEGEVVGENTPRMLDALPGESEQERQVRILSYTENIVQKLDESEEQRQNQRYNKYGEGKFGKLRNKLHKWLETDNLGRAVKIGGKIILGTAGAAIAGSLTGGIGLIAAPILFSMGSKEAVGGAIEGVQEYVMGGRKKRMELNCQKEAYRHSIEDRLQEIREQASEMTVDELAAALENVVQGVEKAEDVVNQAENENIELQHRYRKFRGAVSTGMSVAFSVLHGLPFGVQDFDGNGVEHAVRLGHRGLEFIYNHASEIASGDTVNNLMGAAVHSVGSVYNHAGVFGGLVGSIGAMAARTLDEFKRPNNVGGKIVGGYNINVSDISVTPPLTPDEMKALPEGEKLLLALPQGKDAIPLPAGDPELDKKERLPYDPYNNQFIDPERAKLYREMMSDRLKNDPKVQLEFPEEYDDYFEKQKENDPENFARLQKLLSEKDPIADLNSPMSDNCKALVCIPVFDLGEGQNIGRCLEQYYKQIKSGSVSADEFEVVLYLNHYKGAADKVSIEPGAEERVAAGEPADYDTLEAIKQFKARHPEMKIRVLQEEFPEQQQWGRIIKTNYDAALMLSKSRPKNADQDIAILTNDADVVDLSDNYLRSIIDTLEDDSDSEGNHKLDGALGRIDHQAETYKEWPNFFLATRFDQFIGAQRRHGRGTSGNQGHDSLYPSNLGGSPYSSETVHGEQHVMTQGRNSILRASAYMAIGGANVQTDAGADTELANQIVFARRGGSDKTLSNEEYPLGYINKAWLETNPRRELMTYKEGKSITSSWSDWRDKPVYGQEGIDRLKNLGEDEQLDAGKLAFQFNHIMQWYGMGEDNALIQKALSWIGFESGDYQMVEKQTKEEKEEFSGLDRIISFTSLSHIELKIEQWQTKRERLAHAEEEQKVNSENVNTIGIDDVSNIPDDGPETEPEAKPKVKAETERASREKYLEEKMTEKYVPKKKGYRENYVESRMKFILDEAHDPQVFKWVTENINTASPEKLCAFFGVRGRGLNSFEEVRGLFIKAVAKIGEVSDPDRAKFLETITSHVETIVGNKLNRKERKKHLEMTESRDIAGLENEADEFKNELDRQLDTISSDDTFEELKEQLSNRKNILQFLGLLKETHGSVRARHKEGLFRRIDMQVDSLNDKENPADTDLARERLEKLKEMYEKGYANTK